MPTPITQSREQLIDDVIRVLAEDDRVIFAYLYGSMACEGKGNDIDVAVFPEGQADCYSLAVDLKIDLHKATGMPPDTFDVRVIGDLIEKGDIFGLLYLRNVLDGGRIRVDKDRDVRADFLERYGLKFRECEGLIREVLACAVNDWLERWREKSIPDSEGMSYRQWRHSVDAVIESVVGGNWPYCQVSAEVRKQAMDEHPKLIHRARVHMVSNLLPAGDVILDLGGANCPLYEMGYPHRFKKLYLIDLPPEARHDMYKEVLINPNYEGGKVVIRYGDMTELEDFPDESADFVWSGQRALSTYRIKKV